MKKLKVMTVVGTRPEIIRLARVIGKLDVHADHVLVHTGQNYDYELNEVFFRDLDLRRPDHFLGAAGVGPMETIANTLARIDPILLSERPDALLVLGDTNSCLAVIAAKRRKIPVFHMEAGNRCFDDRVPEEINRRLVDHLSDINLPYSERARDLLLREGIAPDRIVKTGSPMYEVVHSVLPKVRDDVLGAMQLAAREYFVVSAHREENVDDDDRIRRLWDAINAIATTSGKRVIVSTHPRTRKRIEALRLAGDPRVELHKPFGYLDYLALQRNALAVLSDSGTINEEAAILGFPALNLRDTHERMEAMEEAVVPMTGVDRERIMQGLALLSGGGSDQPKLPADYDVPNVSDKVVRIIFSYVDYVNRVVWHKPG